MDSIEYILNFSFPEVTDPLEKDPAHYRDFLVNSINLFIGFMSKYVEKNSSDPNLEPMIDAFLKRMEAQWGRYSYKIMGSSYFGFTGADSSWDYELIDVKEKSAHDTIVIEDADFHNFSKNFYKLIMNQGKADMHDLNQLISIVLLGGYENIRYYIGQIPQHIPKSVNIIRDDFASRIDMRDSRRDYPARFIQMYRTPGETQSIENMPIIPLFIRLAGFIVKHPELSAQLTDTAVKAAVDRAVSAATTKKEQQMEAAKEQKRKTDIHDNWVMATTDATTGKRMLTGPAALDAARKTFNETKNPEAAGFMEKQSSPSTARGLSQSVINGKLITLFGGKRRKRSGKRSGHKRSGKSGHKRSGKSAHNKRSGHKRSNKSRRC